MIRKKVTAILKLGLFLLPAATLISGTGTLIGWSVKGDELSNKAIEQYRVSEEFHEAQQQKIDKLDDQFAQGEITQEEYDSVKEYVESKDFAKSEMKSNVIRDEETKSLIKQVDAKWDILPYLAIPAGVGVLSSLLYLSDSFINLMRVKDNMEETYQERERRMKKKAKREFEREAKEYIE